MGFEILWSDFDVVCFVVIVEDFFVVVYDWFGGYIDFECGLQQLLIWCCFCIVDGFCVEFYVVFMLICEQNVVLYVNVYCLLFIVFGEEFCVVVRLCKIFGLVIEFVFGDVFQFEGDVF